MTLLLGACVEHYKSELPGIQGLIRAMSSVYYTIATTIIYYVSLPLLYLLSLIIALLQIILAPFVFIARTVYHVCAIPLTIAARFEVASPDSSLLVRTDSNSLYCTSLRVPS